MQVLAFLTTSILSIHNVAAVDSPLNANPANYEASAHQLIRATKGARWVLMADRSSHTQLSYKFLRVFLEKSNGDYDYVAVEVDSKHQRWLDKYIQSGIPQPPEDPAWSNPSVREGWRSVLDSIREMNRKRAIKGKAPTQVLALGIQGGAARDQQMFKRLMETTNNFQGQGVVFLRDGDVGPIHHGLALLIKTSAYSSSTLLARIQSRSDAVEMLGAPASLRGYDFHIVLE